MHKHLHTPPPAQGGGMKQLICPTFTHKFVSYFHPWRGVNLKSLHPSTFSSETTILRVMGQLHYFYLIQSNNFLKPFSFSMHLNI